MKVKKKKLPKCLPKWYAILNGVTKFPNLNSIFLILSFVSQVGSQEISLIRQRALALPSDLSINPDSENLKTI